MCPILAQQGWKTRSIPPFKRLRPSTLKTNASPPAAEPNIRVRLPRLAPHQHAHVRPLGLVDGAKCRLVGQIVPEVRHRRPLRASAIIASTAPPLSRPARNSSPDSNCSSRSPSSFARGSNNARVLLSISLACSGARPRQCITAALGLSSKSPPSASRFNRRAQICQGPPYCRWRLLEHPPSIRIEPLRPMQSPYFGLRIEPQHRRNLLRRPPRDHRDARSSLSLNLDQAIPAPLPMAAP